MKLISIFSGAGGLDIGASAVGAEILASIEADHDCCATLKANGISTVKASKIEDCPPDVLREELGLAKGELDLLMGGPPCQPFSKSALWTSAAARGLEDPRAGTLSEFCKYIGEFRPKAVLLENVEGFKTGGGLDFTLDYFQNIGGYKCTWAVLDASHFGVPQRRRRLFLIAVTSPHPFAFPVATHGLGAEEIVSAWEALHDIEQRYEENLRIRGRWSELVSTIPEGKNYLWHTPKGGGTPLFGWRTRYWSFLLKLKKTAPAPTIVASPSQNSGPYHWDNRLLSTDELAALQTFPREYHFSGDRASRQRQIGNAVPPLLASTLVRAIAQHLGEPTRTQIDLTVRRVTEIPAEEPVAELPLHFLQMQGDHAAHAGTGKGPKPRLTAPATNAPSFTDETVHAKDGLRSPDAVTTGRSNGAAPTNSAGRRRRTAA